ncbi:hypothetical protein N9Z02_02560 [Akkermansiaceae bacterium]|nr:hypothetical protein [Akkermansiaceae bacterium]
MNQREHPEAVKTGALKHRVLTILALLMIIVISLFFFESNRDRFSDLTDKPRSWLNSSSPMREPFRQLWESWESDNIEDHPAAQKIAKIISEDLPSGSSLEMIQEHIAKHFKEPEVENLGSFKVAYVKKAYGSVEIWPIGDSMLMLRIIYVYDEAYKWNKGHFIRAEIEIDRGKGSHGKRLVIEPGKKTKISLKTHSSAPARESNENVNLEAEAE